MYKEIESFEDCITKQYLGRVEQECNIVNVDKKECLIACEGVYANVTKLEAQNVTGLQFDDLMRNYNKYKRFFELSKSGIL